MMPGTEEAKATVAPEIKTEAAPVQEEKPRTKVDDLPTEALAQRLERERAKVAAEVKAEMLKSFGVTDESEIKSAIEQRAAQLEAEKTQADKLAELSKKHEATVGRTSLVEAVLKARCASEMTKLTEEQRAAVAAIAGDDDITALKTIDALSPTWAAAKPAAAPTAGEPKKPPATELPNTAPGRAAPPEAKNEPVDHRSVWSGLKTTNPFAAARYLSAHKRDIFPSQ